MPVTIHELRVPGQVWKIEPDRSTGWLAIEVRNLESREVKFGTISYDEMQVDMLSIDLPDSWWVGLAGFWQSTLLLHGYQDPGLPLRQGIYAFDGTSGKPKWAQLGHQLAYLLPHIALVRDVRWPERSQSLDLSTGQVSFVSADTWEKLKGESRSYWGKSLFFPQTLRIEDPLAQSFRNLIWAQHKLEPSLQIDILDFSDYRIISWYEKHADEALTHRLSVWHRKEFLLTQVLVSSTRQLTLDPFLIFSGRLIAYNDSSSIFMADLRANDSVG